MRSYHPIFHPILAQLKPRTAARCIRHKRKENASRLRTSNNTANACGGALYVPIRHGMTQVKRQWVRGKKRLTRFCALPLILIALHFLLHERRINDPSFDPNLRVLEEGNRAEYHIGNSIANTSMSIVAYANGKDGFMASPSITVLRKGVYLTVYENYPRALLVSASFDHGRSWKHVSNLHGCVWPQVFTCASGTYVLCTSGAYQKNSGMLIFSLQDKYGARWTGPHKIFDHISVLTANSGVDVSAGRVTKSFETIPNFSDPVASTITLSDVRIDSREIQNMFVSIEWSSPVLRWVSVLDTEGFVAHSTLISDTRPPYLFRLLQVDHGSKKLLLRYEKSNLLSCKSTNLALCSGGTGLTLHAGAELSVKQHVHVRDNVAYGGIDWHAMVMSADERLDLTQPEAWDLSQPVGNPVSSMREELKEVFGVSFRTDEKAQMSVLDSQNIDAVDDAVADKFGVGYLYWMEGVITRVRDSRATVSDKLVSIMRVNNDKVCSLAAVVEFKDSDPKNITGRYAHHKFIPGLSQGHPSIVYDEISDLYWMVSHVNRDSVHGWQGKNGKAKFKLALPYPSNCEFDRSTLGLFYSSTLLDWSQAHIFAHHYDFDGHFTYPHITISGSDLLVVSRATIYPRGLAVDSWYNNHNSNSIALHTITNFRQLADLEWATHKSNFRTQGGDKQKK